MPAPTKTTPSPAISALLAASAAHNLAIYLGRGRNGPLFAPAEHGVLVLGPPRAGKTSSLIVPNVLAFASSVLSVSTKRDVLDSTAAARAECSRCLLFDPSGTVAPPTGVGTVAWTPLASARQWDRAVLTADAMVGAARGFSSNSSLHWNERASALLASLFHGAALSGAGVRDLVSVVNRREPSEFVSVLAERGPSMALDVLYGILETDPREQSGIWSTASGVLSAYRTSAALDSTEGPPFDAAAFVEHTTTLYVAAGSEHQQHLAPIVAGILRDVRSAAFARSASPEAARPCLFVLDELANIAPLHDLPALVAEGASQGVLTLASLQDLSQARQRFGPAADGFFSLFGTKVLLGGLGDRGTLETVSLLAGDVDVPLVSRSSSRRTLLGRRQVQQSVSTRRLRRLPPDAVAGLPAGTALALVGSRPGRVLLTPYFSTSPFAEAASGRSQPIVPAPRRARRTRQLGDDGRSRSR